MAVVYTKSFLSFQSGGKKALQLTSVTVQVTALCRQDYTQQSEFLVF